MSRLRAMPWCPTSCTAVIIGCRDTRFYALGAILAAALACTPSKKHPTPQSQPALAAAQPVSTTAALEVADCFRDLDPLEDRQKLYARVQPCLSEVLDSGVPATSPAEVDALMARYFPNTGVDAGAPTETSRMIASMRFTLQFRPARLASMCSVGPTGKHSATTTEPPYSPAAPFDRVCVPITGTFQETPRPCPGLDQKCLEVVRYRRAEQGFRLRVTVASNGEPTAVRVVPEAEATREEEEAALMCILKQLSGRYFLELSPCES